MNVAAPIETFCECPGFILWYTTERGVDVCRCGHQRDEHIDGQRMCVGDVVIYQPEKVES